MTEEELAGIEEMHCAPGSPCGPSCSCVPTLVAEVRRLRERLKRQAAEDRIAMTLARAEWPAAEEDTASPQSPIDDVDEQLEGWTCRAGFAPDVQRSRLQTERE